MKEQIRSLILGGSEMWRVFESGRGEIQGSSCKQVFQEVLP